MAFIDEEGQRWSPYRPPGYRQPPRPGTPPPQQPPQGGQIPNSGIYAQRQAQAEQAYQQALAQLAQRKQETFRNFGFLENGQVDPNNKFGQLQNLWREQAGAAHQQEASFHGRGIRGGLAEGAMSMRRLSEGGQNLDLQNRYTGAMQEIAQARTGAENERNTALLNAQQEALQEALQQQQFTPATVPGEPEPPAPRPLPGRQVARRALARANARRTGRNRNRRRH